MPLEFSRISKSRGGALTLVIDPANGAWCPTHYAISARGRLDDLLNDLRRREGTVLKRIGFVKSLSSSARSSAEPSLVAGIREWAIQKEVTAVVWTDLPSNFEDESGYVFELPPAIKYLQNLPIESAQQAKHYIENAPPAVVTPLRTAVQAADWWLEYGTRSME